MRPLPSALRCVAAVTAALWLTTSFAGPGGTLHVALEETMCCLAQPHDAADHRFEPSGAASRTHDHHCLACHGSRLLTPAALALGIAPASFTIVGLHDREAPESPLDVATSPRGPPA